jgi:hypothetical protein
MHFMEHLAKQTLILFKLIALNLPIENQNKIAKLCGFEESNRDVNGI